MLDDSSAYSGFAAPDLEAARQFYEGTLGLAVSELSEGELLSLDLGGGSRQTLIYRKPDFVPATYTILNFPVDDLEGTVDELASRGVKFERYEGMNQDERGIAHVSGGPKIAWFADPAGNLLSVHERPA